jgi:hypothetical protein
MLYSPPIWSQNAEGIERVLQTVYLMIAFLFNLPESAAALLAKG